MLNLFIFWRRKKLSLFILSKAFTFRFDHSANEGIGFLWTIFPEQNPHKNSQYELYMKRKAFPLLFTCNSSSLATGARTEAFFVGVAVLPKLPLAFRQKTRSCLKSPDIFPRFIVAPFFGLRSNLNLVEFNCCQVNLSLFPQQTAELLKRYLASRQQP